VANAPTPAELQNIDEHGDHGISKHSSFEDVKAATLRSLESIIPQLLPGGKRAGKNEWVSRNPTRDDSKPGSFSVNMRTGVWSDFATGESGGDMIDLYAYINGGSSIKAKDALAHMLGVQPRGGSRSLTGNIRTTPLKSSIASVATPTAARSTPLAFPPRTLPDKDGKPKFIKAGQEGPRAYSTEKRRHFYRRGGVAVRVKILGGDRAYNAYRVTDADDATGWQSAKPEGYEDLPYFCGDDPFDADIDRVIFWPEGEKDVETIANLGGLAFTFGGAGDGDPPGCEEYIAGRNVVILADNDEPGCKHAEKKAALASKVAASVKVVHFEEVSDKGDVSDWIESGRTFDDLKARVIATTLWQPAEQADEPKPIMNELPHGFNFSDRGLMWSDPSNGDKPPALIAGHFDISAMTRDGDGSSWGLLIHWRDSDGRDHRFALRHEMLAGDGSEARRVLMKQGFYISPDHKARNHFNSFLLQVKSPNRALATENIGWHGAAYVLPDASYGGNPGETLLLQSATAHVHSFRQSGSLADWQQHVARYAVGNSRLAFMLSAAFAGVLIEPCSAEGGGFHIVGSSSTGKTTGLRVAASAWGDPSYMKTWRATSNGLEGVAKNHCDGLLCLDEIAQISSKEAGEAAYMLANGQGKARSRQDGEARKSALWRVLFLSTGEISLASKVAEDGNRRKTTAGQNVRVVDIPADAGAGMGMFENLHGFPSGEALSVHLNSAVKKYHGMAGRAFLAAAVPQIEIDKLRKNAPVMIQNFCNDVVPEGADGQVVRVAQRFALIAVAGEWAQSYGVLPWESGAAVKAARRCFEDWMRERGGIGDAETTGGIEAVRSFLQAHGMSRFVPAWQQEQEELYSEGRARTIPPRDVAGFRKKSDDGEGWDFFITAAAWKEICAGFNPSALAKTLQAKGWLQGADARHTQKLVRIPGIGSGRYYCIDAKFLRDDDL
jgi:putative DNA primase/helicase